MAPTQELAQKAARLIQVEYMNLDLNDNDNKSTPTVISIEDAIQQQSWHPIQNAIEEGDVDKIFQEYESNSKKNELVVVEGSMNVGGQEHFYLETNACLVIPSDQDELTIHCSTQAATKTQSCAARACGLADHKVHCHVKRMGGGFGGKETRTVLVSTAAAVAAYRLQLPVKIVLDRDVDMALTGGRHPFVGNYKVAGDVRTGRLVAADVTLYNNAGYSMDLSQAVMDRALFHIDNAYKIPNLRVKGYVCYTHTSSNTAFRGFGAPQAMMICEAFLTHLAFAMNKEPEELRRVNLYNNNQNNETTHFGQILERNPLPRLVSELEASSDFVQRQLAVKQFNKEHQWKKRGISLIPTKYGIGYTSTFLNQGGALVNIYTDGSVLVTHGGTEMGQGLHTKVVQVAALCLDVPVTAIHICHSATDKVPNASPTAASAGSDFYGMAVLHACEQLRERLRPYRSSDKQNFQAAVKAAYFDRVNLSAQGFYKMPVSGYNFAKSTSNNAERGQPFAYFTFGAACTEVEMDVLTGDFAIVRSDVIVDVGNSLNPAIDIGQIEGAFTQGFGLSTLEEVVVGASSNNNKNKGIQWLKPGTLLTKGPGTYKIPSFNDTPRDFRVTLLKDNANPRAVHSSRAVGEPPLFLGSTVLFALHQAILAARHDFADNDKIYIPVESPLSSERIRMSCGDPLASPYTTHPTQGFW